MKSRLILASLAIVAMTGCSTLKDGEYNLSVVSTGDGHGYWFSQPYTPNGKVRGNIMAQSKFINDIRAEKGDDNVILVDAGDNFLGSNATFYYDYVDTLTPYLYPRLASYMKYDAVVAGKSDFEAGSGVIERAAEGFKKAGIPFLAGNVVRTSDGKSVMKTSTIVKKNGVKVAILGYTNANNGNLLDKSAFEGIEFKSLLPLVQNDVDRIRRKDKPQVVVVVAHTGLGKGDNSNPEKQGLDLYKSLQGVDFVVIGHDHSSKSLNTDSIALLNSGKAGQSVGVGELKLVVKGGKIVGKEISAKVKNLSSQDVDKEMEKAFETEFNAVKDFTNTKIGTVKSTMASREFYWGQCDYLNFIHTLAMSYRPIDISLTATLLIDGKIEAGDVTFEDIKTLYPYNNKLVVLTLTGQEVKDYLEASYDLWIDTVNGPDAEHVLKMKQTKDYGTGGMTWKLAKSPANFDSAAGIDYTVDVTKPYGSRVNIISMADGNAFDMDKNYSVGITTYRSVGSGGLLKAAGLETYEDVENRITYKGPEFRTILYEYFKKNGSIDPSVIGNPKVTGTWKFIPDFAEDIIKKDVDTLYPSAK